MNPYAVLGVDPTATDAEIREAYLRRSKELHPDLSGPDGTRAMQELNAAYEQLRTRGATPPPPPTASWTPRPTTYAAPAAAPPRRKRWIALAVAAVVIGSAFALVNADSRPQHVTPASPDATVDFTRVEGACLAYNDAGQLDDFVDCTRPHAARVMKVVDHGTACPVWTDSSIPGATKDLCLDTHQ
jgi:hypothetical protein